MEYKLHFIVILFLTFFCESIRLSVACFQDEFAESDQESQIDYVSYRLPKEICPVSYDLWLYTRLVSNDFTYSGHVEIAVQVSARTDTIVVHNDGLKILKEKSVFYRRVGKSVELISIGHERHDTERQFYLLNFTKNLEPGQYTLILHFTGEIRDDVFGFYRSSYSINGQTKWLGVTQFSPTYARRAFPCMDEPHLKAKFTLHIGHRENVIATSNTPIKNVIVDPNDENYRITHFFPTPRMSTYIVGWAVHDFLSETSSSSKNFTMWSRDTMYHRGSIALNRGQSIYAFLENWFSMKNPIPKMDQFSVPDFNFNAMENWGLITYRESVVLHESTETPTKTIINGLTTMAHEYAHTWFGNLVTPSFWDVVWLKEGFASYFQYFGVAMVEPNWRMMEMFVVDTLQPTLLADSDDHNRTMNGQQVGSPSSIMATLDFVSYKKAASVIRMLTHVIGDTVFQKGLQSYLRDMSYSSASPSDLYHHLQVALDNSDQLQRNIVIEDFLESWACKPGYPVVTVTRNYETQTLVVSQERFYQNYSKLEGDSTDSMWWIPLNFVTKSRNDFSRTAPRNWLRPQNKSLIIESIKSEDWVIFNVQQVGYYRVNYEENNWRMLIDYLRSKDFKEIHPLNRAALLDDAFNLARAGYIDYSIPFNLSRYLIQETEYEPWVAAVNNFDYLNRILSGVPGVQKKFQEYVIPLLEPIYKQLTFNETPGEDLTTKLHRSLILSASCSVNNVHCLKTSKTLFGLWIFTSSETILRDVKNTVYCEGIRSTGNDDWYTVWERFLRTDLHTEQELLLRGLGCTEDPKLIVKYLDLLLSPEHGIRKQYEILVVNAILNGSPKNVDHVLEFLQSNFERIVNVKGYRFLSKTIAAIGNKITTEEQMKKLHAFVNEKERELGTALSAAKQAVSSAMRDVEWIKKYSGIIFDYLN